MFKKSNLDPNFANAAMSNLQSGSRMTESTYINLCTLLEKTNLSWKKLGLTILKEQRGFYVVDSTYYKMNTLFESVVSITEEIAKGLSISQYMTQWLGKELPRNALKDINLSPEQMQNLQQLIQQVQTTWGKDKGKAALTELAKEAWDISVSARNLRIASLSSRTHNSYNGMDVKKAIASLAQLKATRPADFNEIIHAVMNENKKDTK